MVGLHVEQIRTRAVASCALEIQKLMVFGLDLEFMSWGVGYFYAQF